MWTFLRSTLLLLAFGSQLFTAAQGAEVYCLMAGGMSATNGSTPSFQNVCVGQDYCYLTISAEGHWLSGCTQPTGYSPPPSTTTTSNNQSGTYCRADASPAYCQCSTNFCNTPNNAQFLAYLGSTLTNIAKPADAGNVTCFECGTPYVWNADGTRSFAPFSVPCDGSSFCTGKYCVTRTSTNPRSYCATSWEGPKEVRCAKLNDPHDDQECICEEDFCNALESNATVTNSSSRRRRRRR